MKASSEESLLAILEERKKSMIMTTPVPATLPAPSTILSAPVASSTASSTDYEPL